MLLVLLVRLGGGDGLLDVLLRTSPLVPLLGHPCSLGRDDILRTARDILSKEPHDLLVAAATLLVCHVSPVLSLCLHAEESLHLVL